jgi:hypothetical protein
MQDSDAGEADDGGSKEGTDQPKVCMHSFSDPAKSGYRVFPAEIEDGPNIFFHGTAAKNLEAIREHGFRAMGTLPSVSFAKNSTLALRYACEARSEGSPDGCIIAVRFDDVNKPGIKSEPFGLHVNPDLVQPHIVCHCIVPSSYRFV